MSIPYLGFQVFHAYTFIGFCLLICWFSFFGSLGTWLRSKEHESLVENETSQQIGKEGTLLI